VVNPGDGPGSYQDQNYVAGINDLRAAGITVVGYVYTSYASRSVSAVTADMDQYKAWYSLDGFFLDEMSTVPGYESYYSALTSHAQSIGLPLTVGNPGTSVPASYVGTVSLLVIYENSGAPSMATLSSDSMGMNRANFAFLSYSTGLPTEAYLSSATDYVGYLYATDASMPAPYATLASYYSSLAQSLVSQSQTAPVTVQSVDSQGNPISGLWTVVTSGGSVIATGFTPLTFWGTVGTQYAVTVSNYGAYVFNHWDDLTTNPTRVITVTQQATLTAYYGAPQIYSVNVQSISLSGSPVYGLWTTVELNGNVVATGFTPFTYTGTTGGSYTVTVYDYGAYSFSHWDDWTTNPSRTFTLSQDLWFTALYST
jgi:hypothetical protein